MHKCFRLQIQSYIGMGGQKMSFYTLDKESQIYGDYIKRLGDVLREYNGKYEVTLAISTLQSLLTVLIESKLYSKQKDVLDSLSYAEGVEKIQIINKIVSSKPIFEISKSSIIENTFVKNLTIKDILKHLRNTLSHPMAGNTRNSRPKTGFYTIQNDIIEKIVFVESPDYDRFHPSIFNRFEEYKENLGFPKNSKIKDNKVYLDDTIYRRYIKIELTPDQLKSLILNLCELFSEFVMKAEDPSNTIKMLAQKFAA